MVKIKLNLFESIIVAITLPNAGFVLNTFVLLISLVVKQEQIVYNGITIAYIAYLILMVVMVVSCFLINVKSKKEFFLNCDRFVFLHREYSIEQIVSCEYYVCKWYAIPIAFVYKQQAGGLFVIKMETGEKIMFKIFFKDYLKLKNYIKNITEK